MTDLSPEVVLPPDPPDKELSQTLASPSAVISSVPPIQTSISPIKSSVPGVIPSTAVPSYAERFKASLRIRESREKKSSTLGKESVMAPLSDKPSGSEKSKTTPKIPIVSDAAKEKCPKSMAYGGSHSKKNLLNAMGKKRAMQPQVMLPRNAPNKNGKKAPGHGTAASSSNPTQDGNLGSVTNL